jgi:hypothetical protein
MKIILSRKGFDSNAGGNPSIVYNNQFYSFPIPQKNGNGIPYNDLRFNETKCYSKVFEELNINVDDMNGAHLDPDLKSSILEKRDSKWKPIFGQTGSSEAHLKNNDIKKGDIFLFFGWFRFAQENGNGILQYIQDENYKDGFHAIYGYLQVGHKIDLKNGNNPEEWMKYHPHIVNMSYYNKSHNSIYVSEDSFSAIPELKGSGLFKFDESLILTGKGNTKGVWHLDEFFNETKRFENFKEKVDNDKIRIGLKGYYPQELLITENENVINWAIKLISKYS